MNAVYETKTALVTYMNDKLLSKTPHLHKQLEIIYVISGHSFAFADKKKYDIKTGDIFIAFPNQIHYYEASTAGEYSVLIFSAETILEMSSVLSSSVPVNNVVSVSDDKEIKSVMSKIYKCGHKPNDKYTNTALNGYFNVLMSMIMPKLKLKTVNMENNTTMHNIMDFCSKKFRENITLEYVASELHLSKYYISHLINTCLDLNFNNYINNLRIEEACNLLKETDMKIADISEDVGFGTIRSFNRSFMQELNISPANYRKEFANINKLI